MTADDMLEVRHRPTVDQTFLDVAEVFSRRATCPRLSVGAVLVVDGVMVSQGWNGAPRGFQHCTDIGCDLQMIHGRKSCQRAIHAEANALFNASRNGLSVLGSTLYVTHSPCLRCAGIIVQCGVRRVVYREEYGSSGVQELAGHGITCESIPN